MTIQVYLSLQECHAWIYSGHVTLVCRKFSLSNSIVNPVLTFNERAQSVIQIHYEIYSTTIHQFLIPYIISHNFKSSGAQATTVKHNEVSYSFARTVGVLTQNMKK